MQAVHGCSGMSWVMSLMSDQNRARRSRTPANASDRILLRDVMILCTWMTFMRILDRRDHLHVTRLAGIEYSMIKQNPTLIIEAAI